MAENPPAVQQTRIQSLGREDPQKEETATLSSILVWRIPRTEETGGLQSMWSQSDTRPNTNAEHAHAQTPTEGLPSQPAGDWVGTRRMSRAHS